MVSTSALVLLATASLALAAPFENIVRRGNLPTPVSAATAKQYLSEIKIAPESNDPPYKRSYFKTWVAIEGNCNAREYVLRRDGSDVQTNNACNAVSGTWFSDYDGATWTDESDVDIDHVVPLKDVWVSGASAWTAQQRQDLANDVTRPQLIAVTDNVNESKGDRDLAQWLPPREEFVCEYARAWIQVKHYYNLTMDSAEHQAANDILDSKC